MNISNEGRKIAMTLLLTKRFVSLKTVEDNGEKISIYKCKINDTRLQPEKNTE